MRDGQGCLRGNIVSLCITIKDARLLSAPWAQVLGASIHWIPKEDPVNS